MRNQQIILCCCRSRGFFVSFCATFLQKIQNERTSKPLEILGLEAFSSLNFAATFFANLGVSSTESAAALADFFVVQSCIDIHGRGEVGVAHHALQYLGADIAAAGCDGGVAVPLWYIKDKPGKPCKLRICGCQAGFHPFPNRENKPEICTEILGV